MSHTKKPLPDPAQFPYQTVTITVWRMKKENGEFRTVGHRFQNTSESWTNTRDYYDRLSGGEFADWEFEGFSFDRFNRTYIHLDREGNPPVPPLLALAQWALERWGRDVGLISEQEYAQEAHRRGLPA